MKEVSIFLHPEKKSIWPRNLIQLWTDLFTPYIEAGKFESFEEDITLTAGVRALATHGHTRGHTSYLIESQGQTLLVLGDLILMASLQITQPSHTSAFDVDPQAAAVQRKRILQLAAERGYWVVGAHLSFPGIGKVLPASEGYRWIPVNYSIP